MTPEARLWNLVKEKTERLVEWTRIEARVGAGIPDLNGVLCIDASKEVWLELKVCKTKRFSVKNLWRPAQIAWQTKRSRRLSNVFNLVSHPSGGVFYIYSAAKLQKLVEEGPLSVAPDLTMHGKIDVAMMLDYIQSVAD